MSEILVSFICVLTCALLAEAVLPEGRLKDSAERLIGFCVGMAFLESFLIPVLEYLNSR